MNIFKKGDAVTFKHKGIIHNAFVKKVNRVNITLSRSIDGVAYARVNPAFLSKTNAIKTNSIVTSKTTNFIPKPDFEESGITTQEDLDNLLEETKEELLHIAERIFSFNEIIMFGTVSIKFGTRMTYRNCGWYKRRENLIQISMSFKNIPKSAIKSTIWHELLHIHFNCHGAEFRRYERMYPKYTEGKAFKSEWMKYLCSILS